MSVEKFRKILEYGQIELAKTNPRLAVAHSLMNLIPEGSFGYARSALYRYLAGFDIDPTVIIDGKLSFIGGSEINKRLHVEPESYFNTGCFLDLNDQIFVGSRVNFGPRCQILTSSHQIGDSQRRAGTLTSEPIIIEEGAWIGAGSILLPGVVIGKGSIVSAGAVVTKNVPENGLVAGVPAQVKKLFHQ